MTTPTNSDRIREIAERIRQASTVYIGGEPVVVNRVHATPAEVDFLLSEISRLSTEKAQTIEVLEGFDCLDHLLRAHLDKLKDSPDRTKEGIVSAQPYYDPMDATWLHDERTEGITVTTPKELAEEKALALEFYLLGLAHGSAILDPELLKQAAKVIRENGGAKRELAEEFRRLAAEAYERTQMNISYHPSQNKNQGQAEAWEQAAQMVEDKLGVSFPPTA